MNIHHFALNKKKRGEYLCRHRLPCLRRKPFRWVSRQLHRQGPNKRRQLYLADSAHPFQWRRRAVMAEIHLRNGPATFVVHTTCRTCRDLPHLGHHLEWHQRLENPTPEEVEVEEEMTLTEMAEAVPTDGMMMMISLGIAIDDLPVDLLIGSLLGVDPPAVDHRVDRPAATLTFGPCHCVTRLGQNGGRRTRSTSYRCLRLPLFVYGKLC